jgi:aldehyde dehydrogenase (NAD+)
MITPYKLFVHGEWINSQNLEYFEDFNPATGKRYAKVSLAGSSDGSRAVETAFQSLPAWSRVLPKERQSILLEAAQRLDAEKSRLTTVLTSETGVGKERAASEIEQSIDLIHRAAGSEFSSHGKGTGVNLIFTHWYSPLYFTVKAIVNAIIDGSSMVINPSMETPVIGLLVGEIFQLAGLPKDLLNVITGPSELFDSLLFNDTRISQLTVINETDTISCLPTHMLESDSRQVDHIRFGHASLLVLDDADIDTSVDRAARLLFEKTGPVWVASGHVLVERKIEKCFMQHLIDAAKQLVDVNGSATGSRKITPLISEQQVQKVHARINEAIIKGACINLGGCYEGCFYKPTIISDVTPAMNIYKRPFIGPIAPVITVNNDGEAVFHAVQTSRPSLVMIMTENLKRRQKLYKEIATGSGHTQATGQDNFLVILPEQPKNRGISDQGNWKNQTRPAGLEGFKNADFNGGSNERV